MNWFIKLNLYNQVLIATMFTFFITTLGASIVYFFKNINKFIINIMLGISSGIMIAASIFSLIVPAIELSNILNMISWLIVSFGFIVGILFLFISDKVFDKILTHNNNNIKRIIMLIISIVIHNIPEGLVIGVSFGSVIYGISGSNIGSSLVLALGIGIQNFPEGAAISLPLRSEGLSRNKSFIIGSLSGIVEPIFGLVGAVLALKIRVLLPFLMSFASGAMMYVVISELLYESLKDNKKNIITLVTLLGFTIMMILDIALS